jgi:hypothetical protein
MFRHRYNALDDQCYLFRLYQKQYPEHRRVLTFDARAPRDLASSSSADHVAWVEDGPHPNRSIIKVYDNKQRSILIVPVEPLKAMHGDGNYSMHSPGFAGDVLR